MSDESCRTHASLRHIRRDNRFPGADAASRALPSTLARNRINHLAVGTLLPATSARSRERVATARARRWPRTPRSPALAIPLPAMQRGCENLVRNWREASHPRMRRSTADASHIYIQCANARNNLAPRLRFGSAVVQCPVAPEECDHAVGIGIPYGAGSAARAFLALCPFL